MLSGPAAIDMPSAMPAQAPPIAAEYGALLSPTSEQRPLLAQHAAHDSTRTTAGSYPHGRGAAAVPWYRLCVRACGRLMTVGCGTNLCGVRIKLDLWHLPQVLLLLYVGSLLWSTLGLPLPSGGG
jgi:hypothetical protein